MAVVLLAGLGAGFVFSPKSSLQIVNPSEKFPEKNRKIELEPVREEDDAEEVALRDGDNFSASENEGLSGVEDAKDIKAEKPETAKNNSDLEIRNSLVSWGYQASSSRKIDTLIIHSSYNSLGGDEYDARAVIDIYKSYGVAAHYLIDRKGVVYRLVEDKNIAYHAGVSRMPDGRENVNVFSLGVELLNNMDDEYTERQYESLERLVGEMKGKHPIRYVLGHKDISPGRKTDPWNFDWDKIKNF